MLRQFIRALDGNNADESSETEPNVKAVKDEAKTVSGKMLKCRVKEQSWAPVLWRFITKSESSHMLI